MSSRLEGAPVDRPARLSLSGRPRPCDPAVAAARLLPLLTRAGEGALSSAEMPHAADAPADAFLRAYGTAT